MSVALGAHTLAVTESKASARSRTSPRSFVPATMAIAGGCSEARSTAATSATTSSALKPAVGRTVVSAREPVVIVPALSSTHARPEREVTKRVGCSRLARRCGYWVTRSSTLVGAYVALVDPGPDPVSQSPPLPVGRSSLGRTITAASPVLGAVTSDQSLALETRPGEAACTGCGR